MLLAAAVIAIVTQEQSYLKASASASAPNNAILWRGDVLEVRGGQMGYLQVYSYRRERAGYVLETQVRQYPLETTRAAGVLEAVRLLRDIPELEALGIAHAALYLKLATPREIGSEVFDALGTMADRLARRASSRLGKPGDETLAGHLDVAQGYGLRFASVEVEGGVRTCYEGDAFRRVLQLEPSPDAPGAAERVARAALGLTRPECEGDVLVSERHARHESAEEELQRVPIDSLPALLRHRVRLRRVALWSSLVFERARAGKPAEAEVAAGKAIEELALVPRSELAETDRETYTDAAVRAAVARSAVELASIPPARLALQLTAKPSRETCLALVDQGSDSGKVLSERCTFGQVWPGSIRVAPKGQALAVAVQPLESWRELWVFHKVAQSWTVDVVTPSSEPTLGYVEWAGWLPDGTALLAAREARVKGRFTRSFELIRLETMAVERKATRPGDLTPFYRWQAPEWKGQTLALR